MVTSRINTLKYCLLGLSFLSVVQWMQFNLFFKAYLTYIIWILDAVMIYLMYKERSKSLNTKILPLWFCTVVIWCIWGCFRCEDYWDWKSLIANIMAYCTCLSAFAFVEPEKLSAVLGFWYKHAWKFLIFLLPFLNEDGITKSLCPYMFLAVFYPVITKRYKAVVVSAFILCLFLAFGARTDLLKFAFSFGLGWISQSRFFITRFNSLFRSARMLFLIMPFILFLLAASGVFNVFRFQEYLDLSSDGTVKNEALLADTRTMLYEEVIESVSSHGRVIYGETPAKGYESAWFARNFDQSDIMGESHFGWRGNTESSVLNVFMHFGLIGIFIYFLVFMRAGYFGIYKSNNHYIPLLAIFVTFRWAIGWIEDFTRFDLNMFMLWTMIGMCYSPIFRNMSDIEIKNWVHKLIGNEK